MLGDISRTDWVYQIILGKYMIFLQIFYENKKTRFQNFSELTSILIGKGQTLMCQQSYSKNS